MDIVCGPVGSGKSSLLVKASAERQIPIMVKDLRYVQLYKDMARDLGIDNFPEPIVGKIVCELHPYKTGQKGRLGNYEKLLIDTLEDHLDFVDGACITLKPDSVFDVLEHRGALHSVINKELKNLVSRSRWGSGKIPNIAFKFIGSDITKGVQDSEPIMSQDCKNSNEFIGVYVNGKPVEGVGTFSWTGKSTVPGSSEVEDLRVDKDTSFVDALVSEFISVGSVFQDILGDYFSVISTGRNIDTLDMMITIKDLKTGINYVRSLESFSKVVDHNGKKTPYYKYIHGPV